MFQMQARRCVVSKDGAIVSVYILQNDRSVHLRVFKAAPLQCNFAVGVTVVGVDVLFGWWC